MISVLRGPPHRSGSGGEPTTIALHPKSSSKPMFKVTTLKKIKTTMNYNIDDTILYRILPHTNTIIASTFLPGTWSILEHQFQTYGLVSQRALKIPKIV